MKNTLFFVLLFSLTFISNAQQEREIENIYNACYFKAMPENGKQVKEYYKTYENLLITNKILKDNSGKSYYHLFKKIMLENFEDNKTNYSLIDTINKLEYQNLIHSNTNCTEEIKSHENYKYSNTYLLEKRIDSIKNNVDPEKISNIFLNTLKEKDFEIEYYKLRVLLILQMSKSFSENEDDIENFSKDRVDNSLIIYLSKENDILIKNKSNTIDELSPIITGYILKNKKSSLITIDCSRAAKYGEYIKLIDNLKMTFSKVKNKISLEYFDKPFENLTEIEKEKIETEYSFEILERQSE